MNEKQQEIIEKAAQIFLRHGIKAVTMSELARELGISKKTIYAYFEDKNDLIKQIVEDKIGENRESCEAVKEDSKTAIDSLMRISEFAVKLLTDIHSSVFYDLQKYHQDAWQVIDQHRNEFVRNQVKKNVERGQDEGIYLSHLNPKTTASIYLSIINGVMGADVFEVSPSHYGELLEEIIYFQLRSVVNDEGRALLNEYMKNK